MSNFKVDPGDRPVVDDVAKQIGCFPVMLLFAILFTSSMLFALCIIVNF